MNAILYIYRSLSSERIVGWGVFIPREDSEKHLEKTTMLIHEHLSARADMTDNLQIEILSDDKATLLITGVATGVMVSS